MLHICKGYNYDCCNVEVEAECDTASREICYGLFINLISIALKTHF